MFCSKCGTEQVSDAVFCHKCGNNVKPNVVNVEIDNQFIKINDNEKSGELEKSNARPIAGIVLGVILLFQLINYLSFEPNCGVLIPGKNCAEIVRRLKKINKRKQTENFIFNLVQRLL